MKTSAVHSVVATQNWIVKASHYTVNVAHQSDTALIAVQVNNWHIYHIFKKSVQIDVFLFLSLSTVERFT